MIPTSSPAPPSPGVLLRPLVESDAEAWCAYLIQPRVYELTSWSVAHPTELLAPLQNYQTNPTALRFGIVRRGSGELVGTIGFHSMSDTHRTAEVGYDLHPEVWGRGLASGCVRAITAWGFAEFDFARIQAVVLESNEASIRVLERTGFQREGLLRSYRQVRGRPGDFWMYSLLPPA